MVCALCSKEITGKFGDLCPACEARQAAQREPAQAPTPDDGTTRPVPPERQHRPLPCGDTGRLRELRSFIEELHW